MVACLLVALLSIEPAPGLVSLTAQKAAADPGGAGGPLMRFSAIARNRAPAAVEAIEIGILFSDDPAALAEVNPGALYANPTARPAVGVIRRLVATPIPAGGQGEATLEVALGAGRSPPTAFLVHVLSYRLSPPTAEALLFALGTGVAADEAAAAGTLGLLGGAVTKRSARQRWAGDPLLVKGLAAHLAGVIPERPSHVETVMRLFAVSALGVLGGEAAAEALSSFGARQEIGNFDEPYQVIRASRLTTSPLEAPIAFAIPAEAALMSDVVRVAEADLAGWGDAEAAAELEVAPFEVPETTEPSWRAPLAAVGVGLVVFVGLFVVARRMFRSRR